MQACSSAVRRRCSPAALPKLKQHEQRHHHHHQQQQQQHTTTTTTTHNNNNNNNKNNSKCILVLYSRFASEHVQSRPSGAPLLAERTVDDMRAVSAPWLLNVLCVCLCVCVRAWVRVCRSHQRWQHRGGWVAMFVSGIFGIGVVCIWAPIFTRLWQRAYRILRVRWTLDPASAKLGLVSNDDQKVRWLCECVVLHQASYCCDCCYYCGGGGRGQSVVLLATTVTPTRSTLAQSRSLLSSAHPGGVGHGQRAQPQLHLEVRRSATPQGE
jgi:hypothetical protein